MTCLQPHSLLGKESGQSLDHSQYCIHWATEGAPEKTGSQTPLTTRDTKPPKKEVLWIKLALTQPGCKVRVRPPCTNQLLPGLGPGPGRCSRLPGTCQQVPTRRPGIAAQPISCFPLGSLRPCLLVCIILCQCPILLLGLKCAHRGL